MSSTNPPLLTSCNNHGDASMGFRIHSDPRAVGAISYASSSWPLHNPQSGHHTKAGSGQVLLRFQELGCDTQISILTAQLELRKLRWKLPVSGMLAKPFKKASPLTCRMTTWKLIHWMLLTCAFGSCWSFWRSDVVYTHKQYYNKNRKILELSCMPETLCKA